MPITRSGYATHRRNGSTRAHRKARAHTLSVETLCWLCGEPGSESDPLEAGHVDAYADHGEGPLHAVHRSANRRLGRLAMTAAMRGNITLCQAGGAGSPRNR